MPGIIDVTLRDGGHAVKFDWPMEMAKQYYALMSSIDDVNFAELGYWGQTAKSKNTFYNLNMDTIFEITEGREAQDVSVMIDYHYCNYDLNTYPTANQKEIGMIRLCSRKQDIPKALEFGKALKEHTGLNVSFNVFNSTSYTVEELTEIAETIKPFPFDYVYFADTHGCLDLREDMDKFSNPFAIMKSSGKGVGLHLHDHSGKGYLNYSMLDNLYIDSTDTSIRGMGKGSGNLKLEHVVSKKYLAKLAQFIQDWEHILTMKPVAHELITAKYGITDNYARQAYELEYQLAEFDEICSKIDGLDKDTFNEEILKRG